MEYGVYIFRDDEFLSPIHADPDQGDLDDPALWQAMCEHVLEAVDGDGPRVGGDTQGEWRVFWRVHARSNVTFVVIAPLEVKVGFLRRFLQDLQQAYVDEVDDMRFPDPGGVSDIIVDVLPTWEDV